MYCSLGGVLFSRVVISVCFHILLLMLWGYWHIVPRGFLVAWHRCHPIGITIAVYVCYARVVITVVGYCGVVVYGGCVSMVCHSFVVL